jgi:uncharacterized damage-inducible protein DinB
MSDRAAAILARFTATCSTFTSKLRDLPPGLAEVRPDRDSWSPAQIGCHIAMSNEWIANALAGLEPHARPIAERMSAFDPSGLAPTEESFPALVPPNPVSREVALERLRNSSQRVSRAIAALSSERGTTEGVTLAVGTMSLYELADYAATHMARHLAQVERRDS